ncbi:MAG TPA: hypothetical protein VH857_04085 [Actinomycetes bacterium]|jgi:hypothetical protein|nr:hypothetical protein [Actinomycetes bacterium]
MTDLMDLLDSAAGRPTPPTAQTVADDLRRGRRALLHRRWARGSAVALTGAAVATAVVIAGPSPAPGSHRVQVAAGGSGTSARPSVGTSESPGPATSVGLIPADAALAKDRPFAAALVPAGWRMQESDHVLGFEPPGTDTTVNDFQDKLVVMLAGDETPAPGARHLTVGGDEASTWTEGDTSTYYLVGLAGAGPLVVQVPAALGWDDATLTRFAEGLAVGPGAHAGVG